MLTERSVAEQAQLLLGFRQAEAERLEPIYNYLRGKQPLPIVPAGVPSEVRRLAQMSRVNMVRLAIDVPAQSMFVSGYRSSNAEQNDPLWSIFQANRLDSRQTGVHRAALAYGASYVRVLPGEPAPVIKGISPRKMTAVYGDDDDWPLFALEHTGAETYRFYDNEGVYFLGREPDNTRQLQWVLIDAYEHGMGVCPVVRFRNIDDLDDEQVGEVEPLMPLQDQIDLTTFELLVAQHFQAFRMRYAIGWTADSETEALAAAASRMWVIDQDPDEVKIGEFSQVDLSGYLESREASLQHLATVSQTPPHHLLGKLVNLSAEALVAAESGQRRKIDEHQMNFGESWEQVFDLAAVASGAESDPTSQVQWRDTEARALAATVDALGKMASLLKVPVEVLWSRIPGWTQQDVEEAKRIAAESDSIAQLTAMLDRQMGPVADQPAA